MLHGQRIEVVRSYSYKLNPASYDETKRFESRDFFCSAKAECFSEEMDELAGLLHQFCRSQVLKSVNEEINPPQIQEPVPPEPAPEPSIEQYGIRIVEPAVVNDAQKLQEPSPAKPVSEPSRLRAIVMGTVPACKKAHLAEFYAGWFGVDDLKKHADPELYIEPLSALLGYLDKVKGSDELLVSTPKKLGADIKSLLATQKTEHADPPPTAPAEPYENTGSTRMTERSSRVFDSVLRARPAEPDERKRVGNWSEVMPEDPLMKRFGWKDPQTLVYAKELMKRYAHDEDKFALHMKFLQMDRLTEAELMCLFKLLYHSPDGNTLRLKAAQKKIPLGAAFLIVESHLGSEISMNSDPQKVLAALAKTIKEL